MNEQLDREKWLDRKGVGELFGTLKGTKTDAFLGHFERWAASSTAGSKCLRDLQDVRAAFAAEPDRSTDDVARMAAEFPDFSILEKLGQGSFGAVYKARDEKLMRDVALKVLLPQIGIDLAVQKSFLNEARILAKIRHPNVLTIYTIESQGERIALVTEFIPGETLDDLVEASGPLGPEEAIQVGIKVCQALAAVHAAGLVHRDVKTANILREDGGRIVLSDFGLGIFMREAKRTALTGTPLFMSPEQIDGRGVDHRCDLYALGVVLYWLVTKEFPFVFSGQVQDLFNAKKSGKMVPLRDRRPDLPDRFVDVVQKSLRTDPGERFQSAGEMEDALIGCLKSPSELFDSTQVPVSRRKALSRPVALVFGVLALGLLLAVIWLSYPWGPAIDVSMYRVDRLSGERTAVEEEGEITMHGPFVLTFQAAEKRYVYLINETPYPDRKSKIECLFPDDDKTNPIRPEGAPHDLLPGEALTMTGREVIYVLASKTKIVGLEPQREDLVQTRSVQRIVMNPDRDDAPRTVIDQLNAFNARQVAAKGWWFKKYELVNDRVDSLEF